MATLRQELEKAGLRAMHSTEPLVLGRVLSWWLGQAIENYVEYREVHGHTDQAARFAALRETMEGYHHMAEAQGVVG